MNKNPRCPECKEKRMYVYEEDRDEFDNVYGTYQCQNCGFEEIGTFRGMVED